MNEDNDPLIHVIRGAEELLTAAARGLALWRTEHSRRSVTDPAEPFEVLRRLAEVALSGDLEAELRDALRKERARWEARAAHDRAAQRLVELCDAALAALGDESPEQAARPGRRASSSPARPGPPRPRRHTGY